MALTENRPLRKPDDDTQPVHRTQNNETTPGDRVGRVATVPSTQNSRQPHRPIKADHSQLKHIPTPPRPTIVTGDAFVHKRHRRHYDLTHRHPSHNSDGRSAHRAHPKRSDQCPLTGLDVPTEPQYNSAQQVRVCMSSAAGSRQQGGHGGQGGTHASSRDNSRTSADDTARSGQDRFGLHGDHRLCDPYASHKAC